ncbi:Spo0E family sporulation regulatory protein-aspartic acid phosphatase [Desulfitobacterium sp. THU1]
MQISIEELRRELIQLGKRKPLTDPEVVELSQKLDVLLNQYYRVAI